MIEISDKAYNELIKILKENDANGIRIIITGLGCSGPNYGMELAREKKEDEVEIKYRDIKIFIDKLAEIYLEGCKIDYIETPHGSGFIIENYRHSFGCACEHDRY